MLLLQYWINLFILHINYSTMSDFSLSSDISIEVTARFIGKGSDAPLTGDAYKMRLFDKDFYGDDYLGESSLDENGVGKIQFTHKAFSDLGGLETMPDFYFSLFKDEINIFESKVMEDLDIPTVEQFKMGKC